MATIDLRALPAPNVIQPKTYDELLAEMRAALLHEMPELTFSAGSPITKTLEICAYFRLLDRQNANDAAKRLLAAYATGGDLDHIAATYYNTERLEDESDDELLRRAMLSFDAYSTAGSEDSYRYHALGAHDDVLDVEPYNKHAGNINVVVLSRQGNGTASPALLNAVAAALNKEKVRPLNDVVSVKSAAIKEYAVRISLTIKNGPTPAQVRTSVTDAVSRYTKEQHKIGAEVVATAILSKSYIEGVIKATLNSPSADIACTQDEAAFCTGIEVLINE